MNEYPMRALAIFWAVLPLVILAALIWWCTWPLRYLFGWTIGE